MNEYLEFFIKVLGTQDLILEPACLSGSIYYGQQQYPSMFPTAPSVSVF